MFPETGKNYKKIEKYAGVQEDPAKVKLQRRIERFPGTGPLSVFNIIKRRGGDVKIKNIRRRAAALLDTAALM